MSPLVIRDKWVFWLKNKLLCDRPAVVCVSSPARLSLSACVYCVFETDTRSSCLHHVLH